MTGTHSSHGSSASHGHAQDHEQHGGVGKFVTVFVALCILTAISLIAGNSSAIMRTPAIGWTIMMAVSCAKATLVMLFFMHLIWEANWKYVLTIPASIMSVFLLLMLYPDIGRRTEKYTNERWLYAARPEAPHHDDEHAHDQEAHGAEEAHKSESH
jgi:cytochrome c oxidase subunit 4